LHADIEQIRSAVFRDPGSTFPKRAEFARQQALALDRYLDSGYGECYLRNPQIAEIVRDALFFNEGRKYRLYTWCIMPNHVHVMATILRTGTLASILHGWKSYTGHEANKVLKRTGTFWQRDYFDRLIRDQEDFDRTRKYILDNPEKAGLKNWPWVGAV
jgi:REP element-mobilizing transposase RayT